MHMDSDFSIRKNKREFLYNLQVRWENYEAAGDG